MPPASSTDVAPDSQTAAVLRERRFKLSRACDRCRRRRIKCDEGHPCQACITANSQCTFEEPGKRTHPHKSKRTTTLEDRMHRLEELIQAIPPAVFAANGDMDSLPQHRQSSQKQSVDIPSPAIPFAAFPTTLPAPNMPSFPIINPSGHFAQSIAPTSPTSAFQWMFSSPTIETTTIQDTSRRSLNASYLYFDDEGYTRWQGETSGLPLLDLLVERHSNPELANESSPEATGSPDSQQNKTAEPQWFPNRVPRRTSLKPQGIWSMITAAIAPELLDSLVQCYLSTSHYILPFLHIPTFLADYGNPEKWGEPGFASFIVSICCLASRHLDDPRVRADPNDSISAGTHWFELLGRLRMLPTADKPTLYTIQSNLIAGVYAIGLGRLSKGAALLSEAITTSIDAGLHRSADTWDLFDSIEDEVRKRTFWCVYIWDKQLSAHFGRPPMVRLRDCDVGEPAVLDDEYITREGLQTPQPGTECRLMAFVLSIRIFVVLEGVLDVPPPSGNPSSFMQRAHAVLRGSAVQKDLREEEALLDEIHRSLPSAWAQSPETLSSDDPVRLTQAERLHCAEHFVRLLIHRHRLSVLVAQRATRGDGDEKQTEEEGHAMVAAHASALEIAKAHMHIARRGLMTYYGVHVIHQLTQAGRTLVAVLLGCKNEALQGLIPSGLDALRTCIGLLRRFSGRYICGLRSGDLMEEFCRLTGIPLETAQNGNGKADDRRPPWIRPVRKKTPSIARGISPENFSPNGDFPMEGQHSAPFDAAGVAGAFDATGAPPFDFSSHSYMSPQDVLSLFGEGAPSMDMGNMFGGATATNVAAVKIATPM